MTTANAMLRPFLTPAEPAALHLVMCPFAGASSGAFRDWRNLGDSSVAMSLAVYPGRDHRMREPCAERIDQLADQLAEEIQALDASQRGQLLLAGHSMGAQVAFETCARLEHAGTPAAGLVLSGCHAPQLKGRRLLSHLDDSGFVEQLIAIGGCSPELLADPALLTLFLPLLRADFRATEAYHRLPTPERQRLRTPSLLLYGSTDQEASRDEVQAWQTWLYNPDAPTAICGDHFYITRRPRTFLDLLIRRFHSLPPSLQVIP